MNETAKTHVYRHILDFEVEEQILSELVTTGTKLLDVGTGATGRSALRAQQYGAVVSSIEINTEAIAEFGENGERSGMGLAAADLLSLPFVDGSFDVVQVALHGFDYILDSTERVRGLHEMRRVVRPGGHVVFNGFNPVGLALAPSGFKPAMLKTRLKYLGTGGFLKKSMIDYNGLRLHQGTIRSVTAQAGQAGLTRTSVRNLSGSTSNPAKVGVFSKAPYYVFQRGS